jgi:hypothetical protein
MKLFFAFAIFAFMRCIPENQIRSYGDPLAAADSFVYATFDIDSNAGKCMLKLHPTDNKGPDQLFAASLLGLAILTVPPGEYELNEVVFATNLQKKEQPFTSPLYLQKFAVQPGEGVYLGNFHCSAVTHGTPQYNQLRIEFGFKLSKYQMNETTRRIVELYGPQLNGRVFRNLENP